MICKILVFLIPEQTVGKKQEFLIHSNVKHILLSLHVDKEGKATKERKATGMCIVAVTWIK